MERLNGNGLGETIHHNSRACLIQTPWGSVSDQWRSPEGSDGQMISTRFVLHIWLCPLSSGFFFKNTYLLLCALAFCLMCGDVHPISCISEAHSSRRRASDSSELVLAAMDKGWEMNLSTRATKPLSCWAIFPVLPSRFFLQENKGNGCSASSVVLSDFPSFWFSL